MTVELRSNGKTSIHMTAESDIEIAFVQAFVEAGKNGQVATIMAGTVRAVDDSPASMVLSV